MQADIKYYAINALVAADQLNKLLKKGPFDLATANNYGKQIDDNLKRLLKALNIEVKQEG